MKNFKFQTDGVFVRTIRIVFIFAVLSATLFTACKKDEAQLNASPKTMYFSAEGGSQDISLQGSSDWTCYTGASWIHLSRYSMNITVTVDDNPGSISRSNSVIIQSGNSNMAVAVFQAAGSGSTEIAAPAPPTNVTATKSGNGITVTWSAVPSVNGYYVYRSSSANGNYEAISNCILATSCTDSNPYNGDNYYKIKSYANSAYSEFSNYAYCNFSSTGGTATVPAAPTGVTVSNEGNSLLPMIVVRWNSVSGATGYKVYRSTSANGTYTQIGSQTSATALRDDNPREGTTYYKVKAVNSAGTSEFSSYASVTYKANDVAPCPVSYGSCTVSGTTMTLRWSVSNASGCGTPTAAILRVRNPTSGEYADVQTLSGTATSASFSFGAWTDSNGYVYAGIILKNDKGTSGGVPKIYDTKNKRWMN